MEGNTMGSSNILSILMTLKSVKFVDLDVLLGHTVSHTDYVHG